MSNRKQAPYAKGQGAKSRIRAVSAKNLEDGITRLYGFLVNILPHWPRSGTAAQHCAIAAKTLRCRSLMNLRLRSMNPCLTTHMSFCEFQSRSSFAHSSS